MSNSVFPDLISEGKKYGLNEAELSRLRRYLNDKRMLRMIQLETFNRDTRAWISALTGIMADIFAMDAHLSIWMNKKLEKPRNWILNKLNDVIPTKIDDIVIRALQTAQKFTDEQLLPLKENAFSKLSDKMHDRYNYHNNANYLGLSLKELKATAKENLKNSKAQATDAINAIKDRKAQVALYGYYRDEAGNRIRVKHKWENPTDALITKMIRERKVKDNVKETSIKQGRSEERQENQESESP